MNKQTHSFYKKFDDLQSRIAYLKSVKNLKKEFKRDSITIKKWSPTYLLPEFEIILDSLAFTIKICECGCYRKIMKYKNLTKHHCIKLIKPFGILQLLYLHRNKKKLWNIERTSLTTKIKILKKNLVIIPFQSSTLIIENYSQNQC